MQAPRLSPDSLSAWYDSPEYSGGAGSKGVGYIDYAGSEPQRLIEARFRYRRDLAPRLIGPSRVLEVGSATGTLPAVLRESGHTAIACDLSDRFAQMARTWYGVETYIGDWLGMQCEEGSFDAIVMLGTICNLADLPRSLAKVRKILKPGGFFFFNFPDANSLVARLYGKRMWMFTPSIMQFPTRRGIAACLSNAGLEVENMSLDYQSPTMSKVLGHARLGALFPIAELLKVANKALPFSVPLPGIVAVWAKAPVR